MTYSAVDDVGEAYEATRAFLSPVAPRRWLGLAVVVFFVSGTTGFDLTGTLGLVDAPTPPGPDPPTPGSLGSAPGFGSFVLGAGVVVLLALVVGLVAAVMEFAFVRILERRDVSVRGYVRPNVGKGLSLLALRLLVGVAVLATVALLAWFAVGGGVAFLAVIFLLSPVLVVGLAGTYLFHRLTVDFVVPVMLVDDVGVLGGWRRWLPQLRSHLPEYGVYALVRFGLGMLAAVVTAVGFTMVAILVAVPFGIVAAGVYAGGVLLDAGAAVVPLLWGVLALYAIAVTVVGVTLVQVPVSTYLRYYSLLVLADVSPAYDLVSDVRAHLDHGAPPAGGGGSGGPGGPAATTGEADDAIELSEDVTGAGPGAGDGAGDADPDDLVSRTGDGGGTGGDRTAADAATDDPETDDPEDDPETDDPEDDPETDDPEDDPETDDSPAFDREGFRTETEEPERYWTDESDGGR